LPKYSHPAHYISPVHTFFGEVFGVICWVWVFHRFRMDGDVLLGYRHPWDHVEDPWAHASHGEDEHAMQEHWDGFYEKSTRPGEGDDDDEEEDEEEGK
jgi:hypothetical protein